MSFDGIRDFFNPSRIVERQRKEFALQRTAEQEKSKLKTVKDVATQLESTADPKSDYYMTARVSVAISMIEHGAQSLLTL